MRCLPVVILAFVATTLATDNKNYDELPMDYFDEIGPDSTFTFQFEQKRRDQPSQIEMREENIGRYFQTKSQTTTPASIFSMKADKESQHVYPTKVSAINHHPPRGRWIQRPKPVVPRPPSISPRPPHLTILKNSEAISNTPSVYQNPMNSQPLPQTEAPKTQTPDFPLGHSSGLDSIQSSPSTDPMNANNVTPIVPSTPTLSQPTLRTEPPKIQSTRPPNFASRHPNKPDVQFSPSASYVSDSISSNVATHPPAHRGRPRFRWGERTTQNNPVVALDQDSQISSTPQSGHSNEPVSVQSSPSINPITSNNVTPNVPSIPTPTQPTPRTELLKIQSTRSPNFASRHLNKPNGIQFSPSASYVSDSISSNVAPHPPAHRGRPRFRWGERKKQNNPIVALDQDPQISSTPQSGHSNEPDSVQSSPSTNPIISNNVTPNVPSIPTPSQPFPRMEPPKIQSTRPPNFASRHPNKPDVIQFSPSASYVADSISSIVAPHPPARRGRPKFRWGERTTQNNPVVALDQDPQISTTPQSIQKKPPPPVPTLSPWYDHFGK